MQGVRSAVKSTQGARGERNRANDTLTGHSSFLATTEHPEALNSVSQHICLALCDIFDLRVL
jgi:hypothetical protein